MTIKQNNSILIFNSNALKNIKNFQNLIIDEDNNDNLIVNSE